MLIQVALFHKITIMLFGLFAAVAGIAQGAAFLHVDHDSGAAGLFFYQIFVGTVDVLFPFLFVGLTLGLLPSDISTGFIRHFITLPVPRSRIMGIHIALLYVISLVYLMLLAGGACLVAFVFKDKALLVPVLSWKVWAAIICLTSVNFLTVQLLTMITYLVTRNRIRAFVSVMLLLFIFEIIAGVANAYPFFPTTDIAFFAELLFDFHRGFEADLRAVGTTVASIAIWNITLYLGSSYVFSKLNLNT